MLFELFVAVSFVILYMHRRRHTLVDLEAEEYHFKLLGIVCIIMYVYLALFKRKTIKIAFGSDSVDYFDVKPNRRY